MTNRATRKLPTRKLIIYALFTAIVLLFVGICIYLFSTPIAQQYCARGVLNCLSQHAGLGFWEKIGQGFFCLWQNVKCVIFQYL